MATEPIAPDPEPVAASLRAEEARALLAAIVSASDDAIVSKTLDGVILSWNAGAERLFGYPRAEAVGRSINLIIPEELRHEEQSILERLRRGERIDHFETVRVTKDGRRIDISLTISPIRDQAGRIVGASKVARDITERRQAEEALREADRRKDHFLATLSHELRNPLAPIRNSLEIMKEAEGDADAVRRARATIERQLEQLVRLVDDLLDLSRITRDKLELRKQRFELAPVVEQAVSSFRPLAERREQGLEVALPAEPILLDADPVRLAQVLVNLLNNASKYSERGGTIRLAAERRGEEAVISVEDDGIGIPPEKLETIFEMFSQVEETLERSRGGLGIGLTLVKRLVELHGGAITAHSPGLGRGSRFVVRLPVASGRPEGAAPETAASESAAAAPSRRVLVVDDNRDSADSLAAWLELNGHRARIAYDGVEAVEAAESFRPDVVLLDIGLPRMNGFDACRRIRERPWGAGVVMVALTGWGQEQDRLRSREAGFDSHMVKPPDHRALLELLASPAPR
jgi:PAS domain S-box-containing protein